MNSQLLIVGVNHRTAPVKVRERLAYAPSEIVPALSRLKSAGLAIGEAALISTCNRVEIVGVTANPQAAAESALQFIGVDRRTDSDSFSGAAYRFTGTGAARHLFRVGASLDSMVVGEPQILGQLKLAYAQAVEAGSAGLVLHRAFHRAFSVAKRVRKATLIGRGAVSVSSVAVALAAQIFDNLTDKTIMLMGAGNVAELVARQLKRRGVEELLVTSRTFDRAVSIARELGGTAVPFDHYRPYLKIADVVIGSLAVENPVFTPEEIEPIIRERHYRPMFLIDLGVPRNFDERLNGLENVYLYDIDDLGQVALKSRSDREHEAAKAEIIVELEVEAFDRWIAGLGLVPAIKDIRLSMEQLRDYELNRHRAWLSALDPDGQAKVESLTRGLVNKVLHRVLAGLRSKDGEAGGELYTAELARRLLCGETAFDSPDDDQADDQDDPDDDIR
ncbi:MAG: glutamyl-tRNA reductase [Candidatus Binataceae bacterium]|nr:glutamyl-tRNA reductase [Candidatus Binataceae bacterium]